ncbi:hypothetical protein SUGI_0528070 [Cryptomeria japonica]|nr:hypothetical protein SUGI_0528070 [Cryptomeria japonica]
MWASSCIVLAASLCKGLLFGFGFGFALLYNVIEEEFCVADDIIRLGGGVDWMIGSERGLLLVLFMLLPDQRRVGGCGLEQLIAINSSSSNGEFCKSVKPGMIFLLAEQLPHSNIFPFTKDR